MSRFADVGRWIGVLCCCLTVFGHSRTFSASAPVGGQDAAVVFVFKETGEKRTHEGDQVINTVAGLFRDRGYVVLAGSGVKRPVIRPVAVVEVGVQTSEVSRKVGDQKFEVYKVSLSARATMDCTGELLAAENASTSRPFDLDGALERGAQDLGTKMLAALGDSFAGRDRIDYRIVVFDNDASDAGAFRAGDFERALVSAEGVIVANGCGQVGTAPVFAASVEKVRGPEFERLILTKLPTLGFERLTVASRQENVLFLYNSRPKASSSQPIKGSSSGKDVQYDLGYDNSWAVVIGINEYIHWPPLKHAVKDAERMRDRLQTLGFNLITLLKDEDATKQNILNTLGAVLRDKAKDEDRVLVFFAGHGHTGTRPDGSREGYIVPVEGESADPSTYISMETLQELADGVSAKHLYYLMDSCFSGGLVRFRGEIGPKPIFLKPLDRVDVLATTRLAVRQVLTCGRAGERVIEKGGHGVCTEVILAGLAGEADFDRDGYILANELNRFTAARVAEVSRGLQHPEFGYLLAKKKSNEFGDFVLKLAKVSN